MKRPLLFFLIIFLSGKSFSQIVGKVTNAEQENLGAVNIYLKNTFTGTTSNSEGDYFLEVSGKGTYQVVFQFLGYQTETREVEIDSFPFELNVQLEKEIDQLAEVFINTQEDPAYEIIRKAIAARKQNRDRIRAYTADFYSKGNWTVKNMPKKILGQELDSDGSLGLDSSGSGILYLSETKSEIKYQWPDKFHEHILASKVSGDDNGISFNSAADADFSFYDNSIEINVDLVSPIADYALNYYRYKLISSNYDGQGFLINKIEVIPKRPADKVFSGFIYIVEDSWEIFGIQLKTTGTSTQVPVIKELKFNQSFSYSESNRFWVKISQDINFDFKLFGMEGTGQFIGVYSNYDFNPKFDAHTFSQEIMYYAKNANQADSLFWEENRPIPLAQQEIRDYLKKDSIAQIRKSKTYQDSIDVERNKFGISDLFFGYTHQNSFKESLWGINPPLLGVHFNTVQGWHINLRGGFVQQNKEEHTFWKAAGGLNYGFADQRLRWDVAYQKKFNNFSKSQLTIRGGVKAAEINDTDAIPLLLNDIANIFFERNYLKLYDKQFAEIDYTQEVFNGFNLHGTLAYERRNPLLNATDQVIRHDSNGGYTSNDPFNPTDFNSVPFEKHQIGKLAVTAAYRFNQKYYTYPDGKYNTPTDNYPTVSLNYESGFAASRSKYNFHKLQFALSHQLNLKNMGAFKYVGRVGKFLDADDLALVDYKHFKGNQLRVYGRPELDKFNLLPYYDLSTNDQYAELHFEQNFKGWLLGKIPGINTLGFRVVAGGHVLWTGGEKPYQEFNIGLDNLGFGMFRLLRVDYVHSFYAGKNQGAVVFGLKFIP